MKPIMIEYERKFNLGDYESETIKVHISLDGLPGEADQAINRAKALVERHRQPKNLGGIVNGNQY